MNVAEIPDGEHVLVGMFYVHDHPVIVLFDLGATHTFISRNSVWK